MWTLSIILTVLVAFTPKIFGNGPIIYSKPYVKNELSRSGAVIVYGWTIVLLIILTFGFHHILTV